ISLVNFKNKKENIDSFIYTEIQNTKPAFIKTEAFKHPAMAECTENSLQLGGNLLPTAVITGHNGCGKSLSVEAITTNLISSETLGIARAKTFEHSPFHRIVYVAHPSDEDEFATKSGYEAEVESLNGSYKENIE